MYLVQYYKAIICSTSSVRYITSIHFNCQINVRILPGSHIQNIHRNHKVILLLYTYMYIHTYIHTYIPTYLPTYLPTCVQHTYINTYVHMYVYLYMYIYICIYIYTHVYIDFCIFLLSHMLLKTGLRWCKLDSGD